MGVTFSAGPLLRAAALISLGAFISRVSVRQAVLSQGLPFYRVQMA